MRLPAHAGLPALLLAGALVGCGEEMSPTVTVKNDTGDVIEGVKIELMGTSIDVPPLRAGTKMRFPYTPAEGNTNLPGQMEIEVLWDNTSTTLDVHPSRVNEAINNVEILLTPQGAKLDE